MAHRDAGRFTLAGMLVVAVLLAACTTRERTAVVDAASDAPMDAATDAPAGSCGSQDATRTDAWMGCTAAAPFYWDGIACKWIGDCACEGSDCGSGWMSFEACMEAHASCLGTQPCRMPADCGADEYCHFTDADPCGAGGTPGTCWPRPAEPVDCGFETRTGCGCFDGGGYGNRCRAHLVGEDVDPDATSCTR